MRTTTQTLFGSGTGSPMQAASLLRALGKRFGAVCVPVGAVPLAAAVAAAELWMTETGLDRLDHATTSGSAAVSVLAAVLHLACDATVPAREPTWWCADWETFAVTVGRIDGWLTDWLDDDDRREAWRLAAAVLAVETDERFAGIAELIDVFLADAVSET